MKIYPRRIRGKRRWILDYRSAGRRYQRSFSSRARAEAEAAFLRGQDQASRDAWMSLSPLDRAEAARVIGEIRQAQLSVRQVWEGFKTARHLPEKRRTLRECLDEMLTAKAVAQRRPSYIKTLRVYVGAFIRGREELFVDQINAAMVEAWLHRHKNPGTRGSRLRLLSAYFSFCRRRNDVAVNPCQSLESVQYDRPPPQILSPEQAGQCLTWTRENRPRLLGWLVLAMFAGVRPQELQRLSPAKVDVAEGFVVVDTAASKVRTRRIVYLMPAAVAWLKWMQGADVSLELPVPNATHRKWVRQLRQVLGFKGWPPDIFRHTAASYLMAHRRDAGKVAAELGNSPAILLTHYHELVSREKAEQFWGLMP